MQEIWFLPFFIQNFQKENRMNHTQNLVFMKPLKIIFALLLIQFSIKAQSTNSKLEFERIREKTQDLALKNIDSAEIYAEKLVIMAKTSKSDELLAKAFSTQSLIKQYHSKTDVALLLNQQSCEINKKLGNNSEIAKNYYRFGSLYDTKSDYVKATENYLKSIELAEKEKLYSLVQKNYRKLSVLNTTQEKYNDALKYAHKAVEISDKFGKDSTDMAENFFTLAISCKYLNKFDFAERYFNKAYHIFEKQKYSFKMADILCEKAAIFNETNLLKSISISLAAQKIFDEIDPEIITSINNMGNVAETLFRLAQNDSLIKKINNPEIPKNKQAILEKAEKYLIKSIDLSKKQNIQQAILYYSGLLSDIQAYRGDYKNAYKNLQYKFKYNDSLFSQTNKNAIAKLESEKEILQLNAENKQKSNNNKILIGLFLGLSVLSFLGYRNFRNRQKIQQFKITELEKDKQLLAVDAMLKGQEDERNRIAKDLHDGLGGMLSGVKMSFTTMKENMIMSAENVGVFEHSIAQLDSTISELRKIAHNLMPEALVRFGLNDAIKDFCTSIMSATHIDIFYENLGEARNLDNTANTYIYRIIQELVNNAIKHGNPKQILVQMTTTPNKILLTVEDDGKGMDANKMAISKGIGIINIQHRVNYFKGNVVFENKNPQGTVVNIELNV